MKLEVVVFGVMWSDDAWPKCKKRTAKSGISEKPPGCKLPHDWLVMLSTDLATFGAIYSTNGPICMISNIKIRSYYYTYSTEICYKCQIHK